MGKAPGVRGLRAWALVLVTLLGFPFPLVAGPSPTPPLVLILSDLPPSVATDVAAGLREELVVPSLVQVSVPDGADPGEALRRELTRCRPTVVVCLGTRLWQAAAADIPPDVSVVGLGVGGMRSAPPPPFPVVCVDVGPGAVAAALRRLVPAATRIGVLSSLPEATPPLGPPFDVHRIRTRRDVARATLELLDQTDALWLVPDPIVLQAETARYLMARALERGRPVVGPSRSFVQAGALFCLEPDLRSLGTQVGSLASRILAGESPEPGMVPPARTRVVVNGSVARILGLDPTRILLLVPDAEVLEAR